MRFFRIERQLTDPIKIGSRSTRDWVASPSFGREATALSRCADCWQSVHRPEACKVAYVLFDVGRAPGDPSSCFAFGLRHERGCSAVSIPVIIGAAMKARVSDAPAREGCRPGRANARRRQLRLKGRPLSMAPVGGVGHHMRSPPLTKTVCPVM